MLPAYVIPFRVNKEEAITFYKAWTKKGLLTPWKLKSKATINKMMGMYVPFWLYDYKADMHMVADATRVRSEVRGDDRIVHTDHFEIVRDVEADYIKVPADASERMPDTLMDRLEPFMYAGLEEFDMSYLSGYYVEKYDYTSEEMTPRVEERIKDYIYDLTKGTITGYNSVDIRDYSSSLCKMKARYALLPVWMINYTYKGKKHMFAINGQTGKIVADRPIDIIDGLLSFLLVTGIAYAVLLLLALDFVKNSSICLLIAIIIGAFSVSMMALRNRVKMTANGSTYVNRNDMKITVHTDKFIKTTTSRTNVDKAVKNK